MLPMAILAGGLASRIRPLTDTIPKSLVSIAGQPFVFHQLQWAQRQGIERVVLCVGHLGDQVQEAVGDGDRFGLTVQYSFDGPTPLGTGGAIKHALPLLGGAFFILHGDAYLRCDLAQMTALYRDSQRKGVMAVLRNDNRWDASNVEMFAGELIVYDKRHPRSSMSHIDYGISILSRRVFESYDAPSFDLADVLHDLSLHRELAAFEVYERFFEIGSMQGIADTEAFLLRH
jgi:MurNAc alpha-1-phosphate uridylyltransferase